MIRARATDDQALDLAGNDYLGLARHPDVSEAAAGAARRWGAGSTGSRLVTGTTELHAELETTLAEHYGTESALVFSSGYTANVALLTALTGPDSVIVSDRNNHASLIDGCRLARAQVRIVEHAATHAFERELSRTSGPAAVLTESVFSVDGDTADLTALHHLCRRYEAALFVDDAHGLGVLGPGGVGAFGAAGIGSAPDAVATVTLSKALGTQGGAVLGPRRVIEHLRQTARTFIFDTALAPACAAAALSALRLIRAEPDRCDRVRRVAERLHRALTAAGVGASPPGAAVLGVPAGTPGTAMRWAQGCLLRSLRVGCFRPPSVPDESSRLRLTARADLDDELIGKVARIIAETAPDG